MNNTTLPRPAFSRIGRLPPYIFGITSELIMAARRHGKDIVEFGDSHVRFAMIENEARTRQAIRGIKDMFRRDGNLRAAE